MRGSIKFIGAGCLLGRRANDRCASVQVEMTPYDLTKGRIVYRSK
jgi:hypothetical protein